MLKTHFVYGLGNYFSACTNVSCLYFISQWLGTERVADRVLCGFGERDVLPGGVWGVLQTKASLDRFQSGQHHLLDQGVELDPRPEPPSLLPILCLPDLPPHLHVHRPQHRHHHRSWQVSPLPPNPPPPPPSPSSSSSSSCVTLLCVFFSTISCTLALFYWQWRHFVPGGLDYAWGVNGVWSVVLQIAVCLIYTLICVYKNEKWQMQVRSSLLFCGSIVVQNII